MTVDRESRPAALDPRLRIGFRYATETEDRYLQIGDVRTRYRTAGETGPAVVLIHGLGSSLESWMRNIGPLAEQHRVYAPDMIWFGKSDKPRRAVSSDDFVNFVTRFMDAMHLDRAVLVGNSMGGMIACKTALLHPDRALGLVLVASAGFGRELGWWLRLRSVIGSHGPARVPRNTARWVTSLIAYDWRTIGDDYIDLTVALGSDSESIAAHDRVLRYGADWRGMKPAVLREVRDMAHNIRVPTLIVWGKQDRVFPVSHARVAQQQIPNSRLHILDRCGHAPMLEKPQEFNQLVGSFIQDHIAGTKATV